MHPVYVQRIHAQVQHDGQHCHAAQQTEVGGARPVAAPAQHRHRGRKQQQRQHRAAQQRMRVATVVDEIAKRITSERRHAPQQVGIRQIAADHADGQQRIATRGIGQATRERAPATCHGLAGHQSDQRMREVVHSFAQVK
jgi:hypothetical protein